MTNNFIIIRYAIKMLRILLLHAFFSSLYLSYLWITARQDPRQCNSDNKHGKKRESSPYTVAHTLEPFYPKVH